MAFVASDVLTIPKNKWVEVATLTNTFQIKAKWNVPIYYYEGNVDLTDMGDPIALKLSTPDPKIHEIAYIQSGQKPNNQDFINLSYEPTQGALWIYSKDTEITLLKGIK